MRILLYYIVLSSYLVHLSMPFVAMLDYQVRKEYISKVLCENKDKPKLQCDGKCFLAAKLKAMHEKDQQEQEKRMKIDFNQLEYVSTLNALFNDGSDLEMIIAKYGNLNVVHYTFLFESSIFNPPEKSLLLS